MTNYAIDFSIVSVDAMGCRLAQMFYEGLLSVPAVCAKEADGVVSIAPYFDDDKFSRFDVVNIDALIRVYEGEKI